MKKSGHKPSKKTLERPIFGAIRKPLAPLGHPLSHAKPDERARPSLRKAKHKHRVDTADED